MESMLRRNKHTQLDTWGAVSFQSLNKTAGYLHFHFQLLCAVCINNHYFRNCKGYDLITVSKLGLHVIVKLCQFIPLCSPSAAYINEIHMAISSHWYIRNVELTPLLFLPSGDMEDEEESAMASAEHQKESEFQVLVIILFEL